MPTKKLTLAKTISWRLFATADTFILAYLVTGSLKTGAGIIGFEFFTKMIWFFFHERAWALVSVK